MNADGQRFQLLLGKADWSACLTSDGKALKAIWTLPIGTEPETAPGWDHWHNELTLGLVLDRLPPTSGVSSLTPDIRRAAAADANGNVYWIGTDATQLFVRSNGDGSTTRFWPDPRAAIPAQGAFTACGPDAAKPADHCALATTGDGWLVAASDQGLDSFDLVAGGPPLHFDWPEGDRTIVTDLEARCGSGLWLLDGPRRRLFELEATLGMAGSGIGAALPDLFQPIAGEPRSHAAPIAPQGHDLTALDGAIDPIAIAALPGGVVVVLSRSPALLCLLPADGAPPPPLPLGFIPHDLLAAQVLLRGNEESWRVLVSDTVGNQLRAFRIEGVGSELRLVETAEVFPLRRHNGLALVSIAGKSYYDSGSEPHWARVVEKPRQKFHRSAKICSPIFDGNTPGVVWDRLRLDGCIPPGTKITVKARAGDETGTLGVWQNQPEPVLSPSGSELAAHSAAAIRATDTRARHGTFELLFQHIVGQYLEVHLTLSSDGDASPRVRALRASWPRISWAERYLPALYRTEAEPADFIERFLANMQGTTSVIEERIATAEALFDTRTAPVAALDWLAEWFDVALDPSWNEARRRQFIKHAIRFFGWRGTMRGLESALTLAFSEEQLDGTLFGDGACDCPGGIRIVESYRTRTLGRIGAGDASAIADPPTHDSGLAERDDWIAFQHGRGVASPLTSLPRLSVPAAHAGNWKDFVTRKSHDRLAWQRFLAGRYRRIRSLNEAHGSAWISFDEIALCDTAPATVAARADWEVFEHRLLAIDRTAHRFSVLLPVSATDATDSATLKSREALARRIIALEKPAHTAFDVRFYFAMNRIGEARLGYDTAIGAGSRAPELLPPAILGRAYIGESFMGRDGLPLTPDRARLTC